MELLCLKYLPKEKSRTQVRTFSTTLQNHIHQNNALYLLSLAKLLLFYEFRFKRKLLVKNPKNWIAAYRCLTVDVLLSCISLLKGELRWNSNIDNLDIDNSLLGIPNSAILAKLKKGYRLKDEVIPMEINVLMRDCWMVNPNDRPKFEDIAEKLSQYDRENA